jgi:predicted DNA-binding antitoxin AbrB/MazE fold protein
MVQEIEAVYENGVPRLLSPVNLAEHETVRVRISCKGTGRSERDIALSERARGEIAGRTDIPSAEEVRRMLSVIPGNWSDDVVAERGGY